MWWVYLLWCSDGSLYCGVTRDVAARLAKHNAGRGSKYVRSRLPATLAWASIVGGRSAALRREAEIKGMTRVEKLALVEGGAT